MTGDLSGSRAGRRWGKDGLFFLATFLGAMFLELPGLWCLLAAALTASSFLLFLRSTRGEYPQAPACRVRPRSVAAIHPARTPFPHRDAC